MAKTPQAKEDAEALIEFIKEFSQESDRAAVILGSAKLDILLTQLLRGFLLPTPSGTDELLETENGLGTFSSRINAAYRMGLIDAGLSKALHLIRKIGNSFAHETHSGSLSTGSHRDRIRELVAPFKNYPDFERLAGFKQFGDSEGPSRVFRVALALSCVQVHYAIEKVQPLTSERAIGLVNKKWKPADKEGE